MARSLKIVVAGYIIGFPMGGQVWLLINYLLGLTRLGHEVMFLEDTADWSYPFDPEYGYSRKDSSFGRGVLERAFNHYGLSGKWAYNSELESKLYGMTQERLDSFCAEADLFLNISGVNPLRENYMRCKVKAVIDTDPVFTQMKVAQNQETRSYYKAHDACFTYGCNLPSGESGVPLSEILWLPTVPPILIDQWEPLSSPGIGYGSIGSWDTKGRDIVLNGEHYSWRKSIKYDALIDLPRLLPDTNFELTFSGMGEDAQRFAQHGWTVRDALTVSRDIWVYRDYIRNSRAELTVAKDQNVRLKSGWFSDRSVCYLASARPVIIEDTGFDTYLPVGEGLLGFHTREEAVECIKAVEAEPERHRKAARRIAEEHFDSRKVLNDLLRELDLA